MIYLFIFFFLQNGKASWIEYYKAIPRDTLWLRLYSANEKKLAIIFNKTDKQEPVQQSPQLPPSPIIYSPQVPFVQRPPQPQQPQPTENSSSIRCGEDRSNPPRVVSRNPDGALEIERPNDDDDMDTDPSTYDTSIQLSAAATEIKRRVLAWPFVYRVNEREDANNVRVELLYIMAYYGYGRTPTEADINAAKSVLQKYGVRCEANNLAVSQLRSVISRTFYTTEFPILGSCKLGADSFQTKLRTLGQYNVEGANFDEAYAKLEGKRGEIEAKIEDTLRG